LLHSDIARYSPFMRMRLDLLILVFSECYPAIASLPPVPHLGHMRPCAR
jgi:hypothetical protein